MSRNVTLKVLVVRLTVRDVSQLLNVSERTIYRWIQQGSIHVYRINEQYRFNRSEILGWVASHKIGVSPAIFDEAGAAIIPVPLLADALKTGGIYYRVSGNDKAAVLRSVVEMLRLPLEIDQEFLLQLLLAREELETTAVGDGIALPHARNPIVANIPVSMVALCFLENPINFGALDGLPVHCLFIIVSSTARAHVQLLSKIAFVLRDPQFKQSVLTHASREEIIQRVQVIEAQLQHMRA